MFKQLAQAHQININDFPKMAQYIEYIELAREVDFVELFKATWHAIAARYAERVRSRVEAKAAMDFLEVFLV